jgi:phenylalanyl-tRNA synthetase beta chain
MLPDEPRRLAIVLSGKWRTESWGETAGGQTGPPTLDFLDLKGVMESLVGDLHLKDLQYRPAAVPYLHPGRSAEVRASNTLVGHFGEMHPKVAEAFGLGQRTVLAGELDVEALQAAAPARFAYAPVPRFPAALRDIALVVPEATTNETVIREIRAAGGDLLQHVRLFDLYRGDSIPPGTKSLAYALSYQADDRTLTDKEVDKAHKKIEDRLKHVLKATVRGQ